MPHTIGDNLFIQRMINDPAEQNPALTWLCRAYGSTTIRVDQAASLKILHWTSR
jgi:hypothetical protein